MKPLRILGVPLASCLIGFLALVSGAQAAGPAWSLSVIPQPTNLAPGKAANILIDATNVGGKATVGPSVIEATFPADVTLVEKGPCVVTGQTASCEFPAAVSPGASIRAQIEIQVAAAPSGSSAIGVDVSGGGAVLRAGTIAPPYQTDPVPFSVLPPGLLAPLSEDDGSPGVLAGAHPYQQTVSAQFPTRRALTGFLVGAGHPREITVELPPGLIGNPAVSPVLCTEAQLEIDRCPNGSALGVAEVTTAVTNDKGVPDTAISRTALYNMVPPPGVPAELATEVANVGVFAHLLASVRSDGDYGIEVSTPDILALPLVPIFGIQTQIWGDPSSPAHDLLRGHCAASDDALVPCPVSPTHRAFWTLPSHCSPDPLVTALRADTWESPALFAQSNYESADLAGSPTSISGCGQLGFAPTLEAIPTTDLADSPSGLDVDLHQPQDTDDEHRSTPPLRDATVTLPSGMTVNPSQADGLGACTSEQIGLTTAIGAMPVHFDKEPNACPDPSKLGSVEVTTPLLVRRNADHELEIDPETDNPIPDPLHGSVYLAKPFDNPFDSLLAIYLTVEDPPTGTVAKLAGRIEADPTSGQLTTVFEENPQLPIEDIRLHLFGGARGSLITPPTCGVHTTTTDLVPWSAPETPDADPTSSFQTTATPAAGACPTNPEQAPNVPAFDAGTLSPQAGAFAPFVLKLSREDGSQRLTGIDTTLPPGLAARFVGIPYCSEAQIAQAASRSDPEEGILEREDPSCPASSRLGTVTVGAGAGPTPFYTRGTAYLAGPYKGAPLSLAIITPAIAGPFDLGTVVVRAALYVNPATAQGRAISDPFPTIIHGIPLDLRSVAVSLDRPSFTLNPTSCDPLAITGSATSALGSVAALNAPFQVGGCSSLKFKPKLSLKLKGGTTRSKNPALRAALTMPPGGANIAKASVALPHTEFLDQAHIRTICTRVQFAAAGGNGAGCPAGSVYGKARAFTPLLDSPLEGPVYLRSSDHPLPDLVAALHGQIDVDLVGRIDSVKGGIRTTFEGVPDAPVSKFVLEMQGGKKGLLENSTNLCRATSRATALFDAQNGKTHDIEPVVRNSCKGKRDRKKHGPRR